MLHASHLATAPASPLLEWPPPALCPAGELRAGAWAFTARPAGDLLGLLGQPHEELWQALTSSPALMRVR